MMFRKTETVWTLASQAEIDVWVQASGTLLRRSGGGVLPHKNRIVYAKSCNLVHYGREMVRNVVDNAAS